MKTFKAGKQFLVFFMRQWQEILSRYKYNKTFSETDTKKKDSFSAILSSGSRGSRTPDPLLVRQTL